MSKEASTAKAQNAHIDTIVRLESEEEERVTGIDRISGAIGNFAGSNIFILLQLGCVALWMLVNTSGIAGLPRFDPYPFSLLSTILSLEGVLLVAFVLIRQKQQSVRADMRNHLGLQVSLLAEKEATKIIKLLQDLSAQIGSSHVVDEETRELGKDTEVGDLAKRLREYLKPD